MSARRRVWAVSVITAAIVCASGCGPKRADSPVTAFATDGTRERSVPIAIAAVATAPPAPPVPLRTAAGIVAFDWGPGETDFGRGVADEVDLLAGAPAPPVVDGSIDVVRSERIVAIDLRTGAAHARSAEAASPPLLLANGTLVFERPWDDDTWPPTLVAVDARSGARRWVRRSRALLGVGGGNVLATVLSGPRGFAEHGLAAYEAATGRLHWLDRDITCEPSAPVFAFRGFAFAPWDGACAVSIGEGESDLSLTELRTGASWEIDQATNVLGVFGGRVVLGGDDRRSYSSGAGRVALFDPRTHGLVFDEPLAIDQPPHGNYQQTSEGYALGDGAVWFEQATTVLDRGGTTTRALYLVSLRSTSDPPLRVEGLGARWLHAASGDETYATSAGRLEAVTVAPDDRTAVGQIFAGAPSVLRQVFVPDSGRLLVARTRDGEIDVFDRRERRLVQRVAAGCRTIERVFTLPDRIDVECLTRANDGEPGAWELVRLPPAGR